MLSRVYHRYCTNQILVHQDKQRSKTPFQSKTEVEELLGVECLHNEGIYVISYLQLCLFSHQVDQI